MSATAHAREFLEGMAPMKGETVSNYANRLYDMQMEIYSAHAMTDLWTPLGNHDQKTINGWTKLAQDQMKKFAAKGEFAK